MKISILAGGMMVSLLGLIACSPTSTNNNNQQPKSRDITDRSQCLGPAFSGNSINDIWEIQQVVEVAGKDPLNFTFSIQGNTSNSTFTEINHCTSNSMSGLVAQVTVPAAFTASSVSLLSGGNKTVTAGQTNCSMNVQAGTFTYQLVGNCIVLNQNGKTLTLVHQ
jgi:hypothetical protein